MKHSPLILTILLTVVSLDLSGQVQLDSASNKSNVWSFGTILLNQSSDFTYNQTFFDFFTDIVVKRHLDNFSLRFAVESVNRTYRNSELRCCDVVIAEGYEKEALVRLGIEEVFISDNRFTTYAALDVVGTKSYSDLDLFGDVRNPYQIHKSIGFGLMGGLGVQYHLTKQWSVGIETRGKLIYAKTKARHQSHFYPPFSFDYTSESWDFKKSLEGIGVFS